MKDEGRSWKRDEGEGRGMNKTNYELRITNYAFLFIPHPSALIP
jgi:hypothetical protein